MRVLFILLLATQIQAQTLCDYTYTTGSQYQLEIAIAQTGNSLPTMAPIYAVTYGNQDMLGEDSCFSGPCNHLVYNYNMSTGMPYDTITTCISYTVTDSLGYVDTTSCCFNQVWDGQAWMLMSMPVGINEITNKLINNKMYDLYGREILKPKGIYIQNRKVKYVR
jgi:hypothetical protein